MKYFCLLKLSRNSENMAKITVKNVFDQLAFRIFFVYIFCIFVRSQLILCLSYISFEVETENYYLLKPKRNSENMINYTNYKCFL